MENNLLTYRGMQPGLNRDMLSVEFIYHFNALKKDVETKNLDPFPYKIMLQPQSK